MRKTCVTVAVTALLCGGAMGDSGTWTNTAGGNWGVDANWQDGIVAGGAGTLARFNVVPGVSVTTETAVTVGRLHFDSSSGNNWWLYGEPVTLDAASPEILVADGAANLYAPVTAANGFRKIGTGSARFYNRSAVDGEVRIDEGTVSARGEALGEPATGTLADVFSTGRPMLRFVGQGTRTFELVGKGDRASEQTFAGTSMEFMGTLNAVPGSSGSALIDGGGLTGAGMLNLNTAGDVRFSGAPEFEGALRVKGGRLTFLPGAPKALRPASGAAAHFDASRADTFTFQPENGTNFITRWDSLTGGRYAAHDGHTTPRGEQVLPFVTTNALNGLPVVDFGKMYATNEAYRAMGAYLRFDAEITSVRTAFIVLKSENFVLCSRNQGHYHRASNGWNTGLLADRGETLLSFRIKDATAWKNGEAVANPFSTGLSGVDAFDVICFENGGSSAQVDTFAYDRQYRFGGQVIAEVILYTRVLTVEERKSTEDYLRNKWHGVAVAVPTTDGTVRDIYADGSVRETEVAPDAELQVRRVSGTRVNGFTGGGKVTLERGGHTPVLPLTLKDATLALKGDGAAMPAKPASSPITGTTFHVDASRFADSMTLDAEGRVLEWNDIGGSGRKAFAVNSPANPAPTLTRNALNGLPYVDFGAFGSGQMMLWDHTNTTIQTAFLVFADPGVDSWLLGDTDGNPAHFHRGNGGLMLFNGHRANGLVNGQAFVNGRPADPERTFLPKEPVVITFALASNSVAQASAFACDRWFVDRTERTGDQKLCEVVLYDRYLPQAERRDVEAWLMRKWLPNPPPGYALEAGSEAVGDIRVTAEAGETAAVEVAAGSAVAVGALGGTGAVEKRGGGTLKVAGLSDLAGTLKLLAGSVEVSARALPESFALPGGLAFHLDASAAGSVLCDADGTSVTNLLDASGGPRSASPASGQPRPQLAAGAAGLNSLPVIDFGEAGNSCCLLWDAPVKTVRTVFWVIGSQAGGGMPLGTRENADGSDFLRSNVDAAGIWNGGRDKILNGATRIDGRLINGANTGFNGDWQVVSLITTERATASAFAADRFANADAAGLARTGGQKLAEVLVYDRVLGDLERRDVEAYLNRKWFGRLPQGYAGADIELAKLEAAGGELRAEDAAASITVRSLLGATDIVKTGDHTLNVYQAHEFGGRVIVSNGVLALAGSPVSPELPQSGMLMRMDASQTNTFALALENGTNFITRWESMVGARYAEHDGASKRPYLLMNELNGQPVVEFGPYFDAGAERYNGAYLDWDQEVNTIRTVFVVLGSQAGGNFLVTSRESNTAHFHRGYDGSGKVSVNASLLGNGRNEIPNCMKSAGAYASVDGLQVNPFVATPSGGYQTFCFQTDDTAAVTAGTFARDRTYRFGGQRLAEFIIYDRVLSAAERAQVEAYLQNKWFARAYGDYVRDVPLADVHVGPDGTLALTGATRSVDTLSGSGTISDGTLRVTGTLDIGDGVGDCATLTVVGGLTLAEGAQVLFDYQAPAHDAVTVSGALIAESGVTFAVRLPANQTTGLAARVPVATFGTMADAANLAAWTVTGLPEAYTGKLTVEGQTLYLDIRMKGLLMILK